MEELIQEAKSSKSNLAKEPEPVEDAWERAKKLISMQIEKDGNKKQEADSSQALLADQAKEREAGITLQAEAYMDKVSQQKPQVTHSAVVQKKTIEVMAQAGATKKPEPLLEQEHNSAPEDGEDYLDQLLKGMK